MDLLLQKLNTGSGETENTALHAASAGNASPPRTTSVKKEQDLEDSPHPSDDEVHYPAPTKHVDWIQRAQSEPSHPRFYGKASGLMLIKTAVEYIHEHDRINPPSDGSDPAIRGRIYNRRPEYWKPLPWETATPEDVVEFTHTSVIVEGKRLQFPEPALLTLLVDLYFTQSNFYFPVLHRPSFEHSLAEGHHLHSLGFAHVLLLVCAMGSRFCADPRVFLDGVSTHSAGWLWYAQGQMEPSAVPICEDVYELQRCCLSAMFVQGTSAPYACWSIIGVGIRLAMDIGIHRRKLYGLARSADEEMWRRAFWILINYDRMASCNLGRPCAIQDEDFDLDLPACCDDEYWAPSESRAAFQQPPDKPSTMAYFICLTQLNRILAFALRTLYSINQSKVILGLVGEHWQQRIVDQLDRAMDNWMSSLPDHLRWVPHRKHAVFFPQSALLHATFYHVKIVIHRPFIASMRRPSLSATTKDSFTVCVDAARKCSSILDANMKRSGTLPSHSGMIAFTCGIILLLPVWRERHSRDDSAIRTATDGVHKCIGVLEQVESRWNSAGRLRDILSELASYGGLPSTQRGLPSVPGSAQMDDSDDDVAAPKTTRMTLSDLNSASVPPHFPAQATNNPLAPGSNSTQECHHSSNHISQTPGDLTDPATVQQMCPETAHAPSLPNSSIGLGEAGFLDVFLSLWEPAHLVNQMTGAMAQPDTLLLQSSSEGKEGTDVPPMAQAGWLEPDDWDLSSYWMNGPGGPRA